MKQLIIMDQIVRILESCDADDRAEMVLCTLSYLRGYAIGLSTDTLVSHHMRELLRAEQEFGIKKYQQHKLNEETK